LLWSFMYFHYGFCFCFFLIIMWAKGWFDNLANLNIIKKMVVVCITHISVWVCSWVSSGVYTFADWPNTRFQGSIGKCPASPPCLSGMCEQRTTGLSPMTYSSFVFLFFPSLPLDSRAFQLGFSSNLVHVLLINVCFIWINL
jgi:hypothetical protein